MELKSEFKAIYNPFTRHLLVRFGIVLTEHKFTEEEEWVKIPYDGDFDQPFYLHVQLDYDETFQLLFYPRRQGDSSLHEDKGTYYNSFANQFVPHLKFVYHDGEWNELLDSFLEASHEEQETYKLTWTEGMYK